MDALILEIIRRAEGDLHRALSEAEMRLNESLAAHCADPAAHPGHVHELDLSAVRDAVDTALEEVARAVESEDSQVSQEGGEETPPPSQDEPQQESEKPPESEQPPERTHTLHRRVGG